MVDGRKEGAKSGGEVGRIGRYRLVHGGACQEKDDGTDACGAFALISSRQVGPGRNKLEGSWRQYR